MPWILAACAAAACSRQESAWQDARRDDTPAAYQDYLARFPAGAHAEQARASLAALREAEDWARAERLGTPEAWQRYLGEWPDGLHAALALRRLVEFIPPPAPPDASGRGFEVQLGAYSDEPAARAALERLSAAHAGPLAGLSVRVVPPAPGGTEPWRLRAGPFDEAAARAHCTRLAAVEIPCFAAAIRPSGNAPS